MEDKGTPPFRTLKDLFFCALFLYLSYRYVPFSLQICLFTIFQSVIFLESSLLSPFVSSNDHRDVEKRYTEIYFELKKTDCMTLLGHSRIHGSQVHGYNYVQCISST